MQNITAFILAGSRAGAQDEVAKAAGVPCKALAHIGGVPMIERVVAALQESGVVGRMIVSLPETVAFETTMERIDAQNSPVRSVLKMLDMVEEDEPVFITTADHALLSTDMIANLMDKYDPECFDICVAMLPLAILQEKYPSMRRTALKFQDGKYKACNLFLFKNKKAAQNVLNLWLTIEANRKTPWKMIRALGPWTLLCYIFGRLSLDAAFARLGKITDTTMQPVMLDIPEAAIDVDTVADLNFVRGLVSAKGEGIA